MAFDLDYSNRIIFLIIMLKYLETELKENVIPNLMEFIKIENVSRIFDKNWETNGMQMKALNFMLDWYKKQKLENSSVHVLQEKGRTPCLLIVVENKSSNKNVLMYGHIDKQPPLTEKWRDGLGPYTPVIENGKLYGRGGADDGYAFFTSVLILKALQKFKLKHDRTVLYFETDEESGSKDLIYFLEKNMKLVGKPDLVVCLDSGTYDYKHFCVTTTLRGCVIANLKVSVIREGIHSGLGSGIVPDNFRVIRHLLSEFEDVKTGKIPSLEVDIPEDKYQQAYNFVKEFNGEYNFSYPFLDGVQKMEKNGFRNYLGKCWMPTLTITGINDIPTCENGGNVLRPSTTVKLSIRLPPTLNGDKAIEILNNHFMNTKPLYNAKVELTDINAGTGFNCKTFDEKLIKIMENSAKKHFGDNMLYYGEGGSIPFINDLAVFFPKAQFIITGVLGPDSNAHGPNEFIHLSYLEKLTKSMTEILEKFAD